MKDKKKNEWSEVDTLVDPKSKIAVRISELHDDSGRPKGKFTIQLAKELSPGRLGKFIDVPCRGAEHPVADIVYTLVKAATERIDSLIEERKQAKPKKDRPERKKEKRRQGGLSALARKDAEAGGHEYVGPTARRKKRKKEQRSA